MSLMNKKLKAMYIAQGIGLSVIAISTIGRTKAKTIDENVVCDTALRWGSSLFIHATLIVVGVNTVRLFKKVVK